MAAEASDLFKQVATGTKTSLAAPGKAEAAASINIASATNWPTDTGVVFAIRQVDADGVLIPGTYTEWEGVVAGTTIDDLNLRFGTDQTYPAGSTTEVFIVLSAARENDLIEGILIGHNQDGTHKSAAVPNGSVTSSKLADGAVTFAKIASAAVIDLLEVIYPIGSIYTNASDDTNPATLLGFGTWSAFAAGRVLVGIDAGQTEFDTAEETGGAKTHTLTTAEMPSHNHTTGSDSHTHTYTKPNSIVIRKIVGSTDGNNGLVEGTSSTSTSSDGHTHSISSTGSGTAHNNLQPYIVVHMWKRTA